MRHFIGVVLVSLTFLFAENAVFGDTTWTGTTGNLIDSTWSGGSSPFSQSVSGFAGVDYSNAYQGIYINSGTVTSSGTGFYVTSVGGSNLGDKPDYANRTVLRLTGGELIINPAATQFTVYTGAGFIQSGGTLTMNTPNLTMSFEGSKVENTITNGTIAVKNINLVFDGKINFGGTATVTAKSGLTMSEISRFEVSENANVKLNFSAHPSFKSTAGTDTGIIVSGGTLTLQTTANLEGYVLVSGGKMVFDGTGTAGGANANVSNSGGDGDFNVSGGEVEAKNVRIGNNAGSVGKMTITTGKVTATETAENQSGNGFFVGNNGKGTLTMSGGEIDAKGYFYVGRSNASTGTANLSGNAKITVAKNMEIGVDGKGTLTMSGGEIDAKENFYLGRYYTSTGTANLSGNAKITVAKTMEIGKGGTGTLTVDGGNVIAEAISMGLSSTGQGKIVLKNGSITVNKKGDNQDVLNIGNTSTKENTFTQTGGSFSSNNFVNVGFNGGKGILNISSGKFDTDDSMYLARTGGSSVGEMTLSGDGELYTGKNLVIGEHGTATFTQTGGKVYAGDTNLMFCDFMVGRQSGSTGTYNLSGGEMKTRYFRLGMNKDNVSGGTGTFNISGGTVTATNFNMNEASAIHYTVEDDQFGTMNFTENATLAGTNNTITVNTKALFLPGVTSGTLLSVGTASDLSNFTVNNNSDVWVISGNTTNSQGITLTMANPQASYVIDSGYRDMTGTAGVVNITATNMKFPYVLDMTVDNLTDALGGGFAQWLTDESDYTAQYLGDGVVRVGFFEELASTNFAWDFSQYAAADNLSLAGLSGMTYIPEPTAWLLMVLGLFWGRRFYRSGKKA